MSIFRLLFVGVICFGFAQAGILDFIAIDKAKEAYENREYDATISHLNALKDSIKDPALEYDIANAYYKKGKYEEALKHYKKAQGVDEAHRLYNMGNAYANSGDIQSAIDVYEESLKLRDDADARKNIEILKQMKKEQQQNQNQNQEQNSKNQDQEQEQNSKNQGQEQQEKSKRQKEQEQKDTKSSKPMTQQEKEEALSKKQVKHLMEKLKSKEMPTMMYRYGDSKKEDKDEKPW
jgi:Ca-activated chloride channel family protein